VSEIPLKTRVYTIVLVLITAVATAIAWRVEHQAFPANHTSLLIIAGILLVMIVVAEVLDVSFPQAGQTFTVSVSAAFCFAAGLTIGPVFGGIVAALAHIIDGIIARRQAIKITVNAAGIGLSTIAGAALYFALAEPAHSPIGSYQNLLAVILSATVYALINTGSLAVIVAPVVGISPFEMFRTNTGGLHVELLTLVTFGSVIPLLVSENPLSIVLLIVPLLLGPHRAFKGVQQAHQETRVAMEGLAARSLHLSALHPSNGIRPDDPRRNAPDSCCNCRSHHRCSSRPRPGQGWLPGCIPEKARGIERRGASGDRAARGYRR
jgi:hypothetical protein